MQKILKNAWAATMTEMEVNNWIEAMIETGRTESYGYWKPGMLVRCPFNQPLAEITEA